MINIMKYPSKIGDLTIASKDGAVVGLWIQDQKYFGGKILQEETTSSKLKIFGSVKKWLDAYFAGQNPSLNEIPIMLIGTSFQKTIWNILLEIPYGTVITYKDVAEKYQKKTGKRISYQAVGSAISHNPISILVPCHRVIGKKGNLTGYAAGIEKKQYLLELEQQFR